MFGLMKSHRSTSTTDQPYVYRQFYCGTCKTLGKSFGQPSRMLLNHDAIFLGELLHDSSDTEQDVFSQSKAYESFNCFRLPKEEEIPNSLQYAAAINVLLGALSVQDHITDNRAVKKLGWKGIKASLSPALKRAKPVLIQHQLPLDEIYQLIEEQQVRENSSKVFSNYEEAALYYAAPTAQITGLVFQYGTHAVDRPELANVYFEFGYQFGRLIYLLDAFEDFAKDRKNAAFNGLDHALKMCGKPVDSLQETLPFLLSQLQLTEKQLAAFPISESLKVNAQARLLKNTHRLLGVQAVCCSSHTKACHPKMTLKEKWKAANELSKRVLEKSAIIGTTWGAKMWQQFSHYSLALTVMLMPEPHLHQLSTQVQTTESPISMAVVPLIGAALAGATASACFLLKSCKTKEERKEKREERKEEKQEKKERRKAEKNDRRTEGGGGGCECGGGGGGCALDDCDCDCDCNDCCDSCCESCTDACVDACCDW